MLDLRNKEINHHTQRVTEMTKQLALYAGVAGTDLWGVEKGAMLHDIGKIGIPDSILIKPGPLTEEEWRVMKTHPTIAKDMLSEIDHLNPTVQIPYSHHERWDGKGYPQGLKGEEIPLAARIFSVIDVWDALTHDRVYKKAWSDEQALTFIRKGAGTQFNPRLVQLFTDKLPELLGDGLKKS